MSDFPTTIKVVNVFRVRFASDVFFNINNNSNNKNYIHTTNSDVLTFVADTFPTTTTECGLNTRIVVYSTKTITTTFCKC